MPYVLRAEMKSLDPSKINTIRFFDLIVIRQWENFPPDQTTHVLDSPLENTDEYCVVIMRPFFSDASQVAATSKGTV